jgi:hypothetical protein
MVYASPASGGELMPIYNQVNAQDVPSKYELCKEALGHVPEATMALASEAYARPGQTALKAGETLVKAAAVGAAMGYFIPARGPAAMAVAAVFTVPMAWESYSRINHAQHDAAKGVKRDEVSEKLARDAVVGSADLTLNLAGGWAGTWAGFKLANSEGVGTLAQSGHRLIMKGENESLLGLQSIKSKVTGLFRSETRAAVDTTLNLPKGKITSASDAGSIINERVVNTGLDRQLAGEPERAISKATTPLGRRLEQYGFANKNLDRYLGNDDGLTMYFGSLHGHSRYSDGMGLPEDLYNRAAAEGQQVTTITDHNHLAARGGVKPDDPRSTDQSGTPVVAENPIEYSQTFADADATTIDGKHVSLVGTEMGTIGKTGSAKSLTDNSAGKGSGAHDHGAESGHDHDHSQPHTHGMVNPERIGEHNPQGVFDLAEARADSNAADHIGGVNHFNLFEVPTFFEAVRHPRTGVAAFLMRAVGKTPEPMVKAPDVIKYNDGDIKGFVDHLDKLTDTTGNTPVIQLNHPRYLADENPKIPADQRGRDYGQKSFSSQDEWVRRFADKYVRQIELIKGGALTPNPVDKVPTGDIDPTSFAGYIDKRVHASPTFGRDFHFGDPVGNPGATGIYAKRLDKESILEALRERRTIATTSSQNLSGVLSANDRFVMGSIIDQSAAPSLALKMKVDGNVDPTASYSLRLWGDTKIGDGKLATIIQQKDLTGQQLLDASQTVAFDPVSGKTGNNAAYYVEVQRKDATNNLDRMWTAPIWHENLTGARHDLITRMISGTGWQLAPQWGSSSK